MSGHQLFIAEEIVIFPLWKVEVLLIIGDLFRNI